MNLTAKTDLNSEASIAAADPGGMLGFIYQLPEQFAEAWRLGEQAGVPAPDREIDLILVNGLGGSAIGGDFLRVYLGNRCPLPVLVNRHYTLPRYVGRSTLVFAVSYSGNTEETLSAYDDARTKGATVIAVTSGGKLAEWAKRDGAPLVVIPGGLPPRSAIGYLFVSSLAVLQQWGMVNAAADIEETITLLKEMRQYLGPASPTGANLAKQLALKAFGKIPVIYGASGTTEAVAARWKGQINENSKAPAFFNLFPELNHNEIVGTEVPRDLLQNLIIFMLTDPGDHPRVARRMGLLPQLVGDRVKEIVMVTARGKSDMSRMFSLMYIGDYLSIYLALLYGIDPKPVEIIDKLKKRLAES